MNTIGCRGLWIVSVVCAGLLPTLLPAAEEAPAQWDWIPLSSARPVAANAEVTEMRQDGEIRLTTSIPVIGVKHRDTAPRPIGELDASQFDVLDIPGFTYLQEVGKPRIPAVIHFLPIPAGVTPRVEWRAIESVQLDDLWIVPMQPHPPDVYPEPPPEPFAFDDGTYESAQPYPLSHIVESAIVRVRDRTFLRIVASPMQVRPSDLSAEIASAYEIRVVWDPAQEISPLPSDSSSLPVYMILTTDAFATNGTLLTFADWKRRKGLDVRLVPTSQINPNGFPANAEVVAYMRALDEADYPDYLLIVGGHTPTNGVAGAYFNSSSSDYYGYTDLDIACRTSGDFYPDLYHGRLPATNQAEVAAMVSKALLMDRCPPAGDMFHKVCVAGQIQDSNDGNNVADRLFCETADSIASYFEAGTGGVDYSAVRAIVNPDGMTASGQWNPNSILWNGTEQIGDRIFTQFVSVAAAQSRIGAAVNAGVAILQHRDHGYVNGVGWGDPLYLYTHVNALTNGDNLTVVFSVNCNSGMYNFPNNFTTAWLKKNNGGAYAVFAPVDTSYSWLNDWLTHGFYAGFLSNYISGHNASTYPNWPKDLPAPSGAYGAAGSAPKLGQVLNFGKFYLAEKYSANETTFRLFHLFGDPESDLRIRIPQTIAVTHPGTLQIAATALTVTVSSAESTVCLYGPALGVHAAAAPSGGEAVFPLALSNSGVLYVTVTGPNLQPYEGQISVFSGDTPFTFKAVALAGSVALRWSDPRSSGAATAEVRIRASTNGYPESVSSDRAVYSGEAQYHLDTGLVNGATYYYTLWVTDDGVNFYQP